MFNTNDSRQMKMELVCIENLVPEDHLLRKIAKYVDFSFIAEITRPYYSEDKGRPCLDPVILFKMLFLGYLYGIRSERRLMEEIKYNIAFRWFLGLGLNDPVPHHSTISQNRIRRFRGTDVPQTIFDNIVQQAIDHGLVDGKELFTDSTFLKANANKNKYERRTIIKDEVDSYFDDLDRAVTEDRLKHGKKPLKKKDPKPKVSEARVSTTDPDSGFMVRNGKPQGFFYLDHRTVDGKHNIITDVYVTPANVHDAVPYIGRLKRQIDKFNFDVQAVALDAGYLTTPICHELRKLNIFAVIAHRRYRSKKGLMHKWQYKYDRERDVYICKAGHTLTYSTTNREGYRQYKSNPEICKHCEYLDRCTHSKNHTKTISRHVWEDDKEWVRENRLSEAGKALYKRRKQTIERSFANAKELHGHRYCRMRGRENVTEQCLLAAACQNIKKIAMVLWNRDHGFFVSNCFKQLFPSYGNSTARIKACHRLWQAFVINLKPLANTRGFLG